MQDKADVQMSYNAYKTFTYGKTVLHQMICKDVWL